MFMAFVVYGFISVTVILLKQNYNTPSHRYKIHVDNDDSHLLKRTLVNDEKITFLKDGKKTLLSDEKNTLHSVEKRTLVNDEKRTLVNDEKRTLQPEGEGDLRHEDDAVRYSRDVSVEDGVVRVGGVSGEDGVVDDVDEYDDGRGVEEDVDEEGSIEGDAGEDVGDEEDDDEDASKESYEQRASAAYVSVLDEEVRRRGYVFVAYRMLKIKGNPLLAAILKYFLEVVYFSV